MSPDLLSRLDALTALLPTLSASLDVREVFGRIAEVARQVLPCDTVGLVIPLEDREHVRIHALWPEAFRPPETIRIPDHERERLLAGTWDHLIIDDMLADERWRSMPPAAAGLRASLRIPVRIGGQLVAGLNFFSRAPAAFTAVDVPVAKRVAEFVALAMSHQRLAEEAQRAVEARARAEALERRVRELSDALESREGGRRVVGRSAAWQKVLQEATRVAATETTVLLTGESGTGKEVVARLIHRGSQRASGPFVAVNCATLPDTLLESELFGYERGAFTGATATHAGRLDQAAGGVLFLDEVAELAPLVQAKLLRVVQEREYQRLGGTRPLKADVRLIAATNRSLARMRDRGEFREDLYYRLQVFEIHLPPLRERPEDILPLCDAFLDEIGHTLARPSGGLSRDARPVLLAYPWPGNARELRNVLERASILADGGLITRDHLTGLDAPASGPAVPPVTRPAAAASGVGAAAPSDPAVDSPETSLASVERRLVEEALARARFNKTRAARALGLTRAQLYVRLKRHGLE